MTDFLRGGGEMGRLFRRQDWAATAIGPVLGWSPSLREAVRLILSTAHPMYIVWGAKGACLYNDGYRPSLGPGQHPASIGQHAHLAWAETWDVIGPQIERVMQGEGATWHENLLIPAMRSVTREDAYWTYSCGPIDDETVLNGVGGVLVVCSETTRQVQLASQLAKTQERLQLALSGGRGIGTWEWDVQADRVVANAHFAKLYGVDIAKAEAGAPIAEFFAGMHPDDVSRVRDRVAQAMLTGELFSEEYRLLGRDGKVSWAMAEGRCELSADGKPLHFPGVSFDITERKVIEQRLLELNADLDRKVGERTLERGRTWQVSPELLGVLNNEARFETSNPAWQTILGWSEAEVASKPFFEFIHPDDLAKTQAAWEDAIQRGMPALRFENRYVCKSGAYRWLSWVAVPEGGKVYCSARDITEDKERAEALQVAESSLRRSQKMEAVGQLTGGLAHDFNNLLGAISGSLEVIGKCVATGRLDKVDRFMSMAHDAIKRAAALTHRLLAFSSRQTLDPRPVDMNRLVAHMEELIRRTSGPAVHVEVVGADSLWPTLVDAGQLENALLNLCINASHAMPEGGRLTIETANEWLDDPAARERDLNPGPYVALRVTDTGVGMTAETMAKAFDPFFTTKPLGVGTGLGLSMVYGFARQSGGHIRIESEVGKGSTLSMNLPRHFQEADPEIPDTVTTATQDGNGEVVLVIDDEPAIRAIVVELLQESGYVVLQAPDGPSGLRLLENAGRVDLLVTDVGLPGGMNGRQVADAARASRPKLKVLFITGYAENAVLGNGQVERWMSILTKPFDLDDLARRIKDILSSSPPSSR